MGQAQSRVDPRHIGIYQKLLAIQNPATRLQMIDTLLGDPGIVQSAKIAGVYANLLQVAGAIRHGNPSPPLPGEGSQQKQQQHQQPQQHQQVPNQLAHHPTMYQQRPSQQQTRQVPTLMGGGGQLVATGPVQHQDYYQQVAKPKRSEKALNFFTACLRVLGIQEEVTLTEDALRAAYKKAAIRAHPDKGGSKDAFDAVTRAYAYLTDILKLVTGSKGRPDNQEELPTLDTATQRRHEAAEQWQMPKEPVRLNPNNLNMSVFNQLFEQTRVPDPDEDGYGDWLKDEGSGSRSSGKKLKQAKNFSEDFNREVFNRMFEEEQARNGDGGGQIIQFQHPQELILSPSAGVELGRDRPPDYTAAYDANLQFTDLRAAYTKENTIRDKVQNVKVENRDFNTYKSQREKAPDRYNQAELAALQAYESQQKQREQQRQLRAAQEQLSAQDYFARMKQLVITEK
jgi:curved DNA-binding protein CbpA